MTLGTLRSVLLAQKVKCLNFTWNSLLRTFPLLSILLLQYSSQLLWRWVFLSSYWLLVKVPYCNNSAGPGWWPWGFSAGLTPAHRILQRLKEKTKSEKREREVNRNVHFSSYVEHSWMDKIQVEIKDRVSLAFLLLLLSLNRDKEMLSLEMGIFWSEVSIRASSKSCLT